MPDLLVIVLISQTRLLDILVKVAEFDWPLLDVHIITRGFWKGSCIEGYFQEVHDATFDLLKGPISIQRP